MHVRKPWAANFQSRPCSIASAGPYVSPITNNWEKKHPSATKPHQIAVNPHSAVRCVVAALLGSRATQSSGRSLATARKLWVARKRRSSASTSPRHSQREVTAAYCIEDRICCAVSDARVFGLME